MTAVGSWRRWLPRGEEGSMLPMVTVFVLLVVLLLMGMMSATHAFIKQRDLQGVCDETATAVAAEIDADLPRTGASSDGPDVLALDPEAVAAAVEAWRAEFYSDDPSLQLVGRSDGTTATVECYRKVKIVFGRVFGKGDGVDRNAVAVVRSPVTPSNPEASIITEEELDQMQDNDGNP